jgi:hypothetical protein
MPGCRGTIVSAMASPAATITHREFKLLLKPERFPNRRSLLEFNDFLHATSTRLGVRYDQFDAIDSQMRVVQFYDTADQVLRKNKLILRIRQLRDGGWPDDSWEVTFKCRAEDIRTATQFDSSSAFPRQRIKFKEELLHGEGLGSIASIYSNNCILESPQLDPALPLRELADAFPHVKSLGLDEAQTLSIVNDAKVFEIEAKLGNLFFGHHTTACARGRLGSPGGRSFRGTRCGIRMVVPSGCRCKGSRSRCKRRCVFPGDSGAAQRLAGGRDDENGDHLRRRWGLASRPRARQRG